MPTCLGNGRDSANSREGEQVTNSSHGTDLVGEDHLRWMALPVTTPIAAGGPIPQPVVSNGRNTAGRA